MPPTQNSVPASPQVPNPTVAPTQPDVTSSGVPEVAKKWSWGGFLLGWIWGIGNRVWIALIGIPLYIAAFLIHGLGIFGLAFAIYLGIKGKALAWKAKPWQNEAEFERVQHKWTVWGVVIGLVLPVLALFAVIFLAAVQKAKGG